MSVIIASFAVLFFAACSLGVTSLPGSDGGAGDGPDGDPPATSVVLEAVNTLPDDFGDEGVDYWIAKLRHGDGHEGSNGNRTFEIEIGHGFSFEGGASRATANARWYTQDAYPFTFGLTADGVASIVIVDGDEIYEASYEIGGASGDIYVYPGLSDGVAITLSELELDGQPLLASGASVVLDSSFPTTFVRLGTAELDLTSGFSLTGLVGFDLGPDPTRTSDERPALTLKIPF